jgi:hypothetical protein
MGTAIYFILFLNLNVIYTLTQLRVFGREPPVDGQMQLKRVGAIVTDYQFVQCFCK